MENTYTPKFHAGQKVVNVLDGAPEHEFNIMTVGASYYSYLYEETRYVLEESTCVFYESELKEAPL